MTREGGRKEGRRSVSWRDVVGRICRRRRRRGNTGVACSKQRFCPYRGSVHASVKQRGTDTLAGLFLMYNTLERSKHNTDRCCK